MSKAKKVLKIMESSINEDNNVEVIYSPTQIAFIFDSRDECSRGWNVLKAAGEFTGGYYSNIQDRRGIMIEPSSDTFLSSHLAYYVEKLKGAGFNVGTPSKANGSLF